MPLPEDKAWFPRKTYGWGWGVPSRWQGWAVLAGYLAAVMATKLFVFRRETAWGVGTLLGLTALLVAVCSWKGEVPGWRWGRDDADSGRKDRRDR